MVCKKTKIRLSHNHFFRVNMRTYHDTEDFQFFSFFFHFFIVKSTTLLECWHASNYYLIYFVILTQVIINFLWKNVSAHIVSIFRPSIFNIDESLFLKLRCILNSNRLIVLFFLWYVSTEYTITSVSMEHCVQQYKTFSTRGTMPMSIIDANVESNQGEGNFFLP